MLLLQNLVKHSCLILHSAVGIVLLADEQDVEAVQQDPPFVWEWTADDVD